MGKPSNYTRIGTAVFFTVAALLLFYDTLFGSRAGLALLDRFLSVSAPILFGLGFSYLLSPVVDFIQRWLFGKKDKPYFPLVPTGVARGVSLGIMWIIICGFLYLLLSVLLPELYASIMQLVSNVETYYKTVSGWIEALLVSSPDLENWVLAQMDDYYRTLISWFTDSALPQAQIIMTMLSGGIISAYSFLQNVFVGAIVSVYVLSTKETLCAHTRKMAYGIFSEKNIVWVLRGTQRVDYIFSGFIRGKILDSFIIGILTFVCSSLLGFPYTPLLSVIIGATNVIPFFGPFIGGVPCFFLVLLVSPIQALYFAVFIFVLQQFDGNLLGPLILGDKTGLPGFFVIMSILIGGGFFGFLGMFFGVPVCACVYSGIRFWLEVRLRKKNLPVKTSAYLTKEHPTDQAETP